MGMGRRITGCYRRIPLYSTAAAYSGAKNAGLREEDVSRMPIFSLFLELPIVNRYTPFTILYYSKLCVHITHQA